jgi:hypothetical protein
MELPTSHCLAASDDPKRQWGEPCSDKVQASQHGSYEWVRSEEEIGQTDEGYVGGNKGDGPALGEEDQESDEEDESEVHGPERLEEHPEGMYTLKGLLYKSPY